MSNSSYAENDDRGQQVNKPPKLLNSGKSFCTKYSTIEDVVSTHNHSNDFIQTRNQYIVERLKLICLFLLLAYQHHLHLILLSLTAPRLNYY